LRAARPGHGRSALGHSRVRGDYVKPSRASYGEFLAAWLPAIRSTVRPSTWESYERNIRRHLVPRLGHLPLQRLGPEHLNATYAELLQGGRLAGPGWTDHGLVFCEPDGSPIHPDRFRKRFEIRVRRSGLPPIRFHDLRHTYATLALQAGVHAKVVSEILGHARSGHARHLLARDPEPARVGGRDRGRDAVRRLVSIW
jgi:Phage integrase, N-terminal SAM-like domain/Phage integrase family